MVTSLHRTVVAVKTVVRLPRVLVQRLDGISTTLCVTVAISSETKVYHAHCADEHTDISLMYQWCSANSARSRFT